MDCQSNAKPSEKDNDLPEIRTQDLWSSSQHTQALHHLGRPHKKLYLEPNPMEGEIKKDRNPGGGCQRLDALCSRQAVMERS
jgi:hypothetical protein